MEQREAGEAQEGCFMGGNNWCENAPTKTKTGMLGALEQQESATHRGKLQGSKRKSRSRPGGWGNPKRSVLGGNNKKRKYEVHSRKKKRETGKRGKWSAGEDFDLGGVRGGDEEMRP